MFSKLRAMKMQHEVAKQEEVRNVVKAIASIGKFWLIQTKAGQLEAGGIEKTWRFVQHSIAKEVDVVSRKNHFDLILPDYTASGRYMVALGRKGHVTLLDLHTMKPIKDVQVRETVRDVVFLHNELFFAAAQKK
ncbi:probable U3 small nucleolar RNA-associated protein 7 [Tanacetum coccineum]